ncbi:uncharacterized protein TNCV_3295071 [Trichonephila clavipes]|uniref:Integrase zinc-binding domain-containing protein n=1 Tax=Trichonephila clavipes TaxID=2585209 RepID=A0A8X6VSW8_TRICX|nr:uncharacterized protein TNCV_3295071 [Trichonephila clavipes]
MGKNLSSRMIRWALKLSEFNIEWEHRPGTQNVVADVLSRNPVDNVEGSQISCAALRDLALNSREQLIQEQREDPKKGHIYRYLKNSDDSSVNATVCEGWSQDLKLIDGLLFYAKYCTLMLTALLLQYKVNDLILVQTHFISAAGRRVVGKFMPKFEGAYRVLEVKNNNLTIWKRGRKFTVNVDQVRTCHPRNSEKSIYDSINEKIYEGKGSRVIGLIGQTRKNTDVLENPRVMRIRVVNRIREMSDWGI